MSACTVTPPIQCLNFDVLWRIFEMNADIYDYYEPALKTTLATSRVCRNWRSLLLSSTSIWAHLIDLDRPLWHTVEGRREIIRRTGTALLWIKAHCLSSSLRDVKHVLNVIDANWDRIQRLEVMIYPDFVDQWTPLYRPALHLESLNIIFSEESFKFNNLLSSLFGGNAPVLRDFCLQGNGLNITAMSWLHWQQLRSMELGTDLTLPETLGVLMSTTNLTNLRLEYMLADQTTFTLPLVSLPKLTHLYIDIFGHLTLGAQLLEHIRIPPSCSVLFFASQIQRVGIDKKSTFGPIIQTISTCARLYFIHTVPRHLELLFTNCGFCFELWSNAQSRKPTFIFSLDLAEKQVFPTHTLAMLSSEFALPGLSRITSFKININGLNNPIPAFTDLMACLPSVTTLTTDKASLRHLWAYSARKGASAVPRIILPALNILELVPVCFHGVPSKFDNAPDPVSKYVKARVARGHPISIIEFTKDTLDALPNMKFLREADGVKVLWRQRGVSGIQEYVCGTKDAHTLVGA